jgi:glycosyltransferase involved in cell wall biosynthesis
MGNHAIRNHKAVCFTLWFRHHNNPRHTDLFQRLSSVVQFWKVPLSRHRLIRALQFRFWNAISRRFIYPAVIRYFARRYETLFTVDMEQIPAWPRNQSVVVDIDDPVFSSTEIKFLNLPQVKAIIVTTERARAIFKNVGVVRPIYVVPQGVSLGQSDPYEVQAIRTQFKRDGDVVIGYHAPTLTLSCDGPHRERQGVDDLDFLFTAVEEAQKSEPQIKVWLLGEASQSVKKFAAGKPWIKLFGYIPFSDVLNYVWNFDVAVYPRTYTLPPGRFSVKIVHYMACGIPIISTNVEESFIVKEGCCGIICDSPGDFSKALVESVRSPESRVELGKAGRNYVESNLEWSILMPRYKSILTG